MLRKRKDRGDPILAVTEILHFDYYYHEQFMKSFSSASYSKWEDDHAWSSQEWKTDTEMYGRSGRPDVTSWRATRKSQPAFSHEETHHDGTAQSVMNDVIPREGSGRPDVDSQRGAWPQQFVIGNDEAELKMSVESRSFVNKVTETNFKCYRRWRETFYDLRNVYGCNNGISSIHGKELPEQLSIHFEHNRSHTQTNVRHIYKIGVWARWDLWTGKQLVGRIIHGKTCHWLVTKELSIFTARRSMSFRILCCALVRFLKTTQSNDAWEQRLGWIKSSSKLQKLWQNRWRADGILVESFHKIQYVAAQWRSQTFAVKIRWDTREIHKKNHIYVYVQWHFLWIKRQRKRMHSKCQTQKDLEKDNGHLLVLVPKRNGTVSVRTIHKESGTISRKRCWWNSPKVDVQFSVLRVHCPEVNSKAKDMENCRYTMQPIWKRLRLFFA